MQGIKHTLKCRCILPQFKNRKNVIYHEFIVFSIVNKEGNLHKHSYAQCNNCGIVHKIIDLCKSQILENKENLKSIETINDIKFSLPEDLINLLESYNCDISNWQHCKFILENKRWGESLILVKEKDDNENIFHGKILTFKNENKFLIEPFQETSSIL